ncbi:T-cell immunoreceptor with Ig and ITIM domains-like [Scomber scombrus]|uniref:T-cell immunoreceptor with Ig and ITIM domains-like n=1 Tax=Scomber scombrus TaxID=13677 RepID=UPI002DDAC518|nr:T-cell immunoreceptor with Ig and ITIM domains-like [Scomber scombrus]
MTQSCPLNYKDLPEGKKNIATYSEHYGQTVNDGFQGKVEFKDAGLKNCSIVIRKVTEQDEGCYLCLFNTFPDGSLTGKTCLHLYGFGDESESEKNFTLIVASFTVVAFICVAVVVTVVFLLKHKHKNRSNRCDTNTADCDGESRRRCSSQLSTHAD